MVETRPKIENVPEKMMKKSPAQPEKKTRNTHQKLLILEFLKNGCDAHGHCVHGASPDCHCTAEGIVDSLEHRGCSVGKATVYRYLKQLEAEGRVKKFSTGPRSSACYQYVEHPEYCHGHIHLRCSCCGRLFHVDDDEYMEFIRRVCERQGFEIDPARTVFYGRCDKCRVEGKVNDEK